MKKATEYEAIKAFTASTGKEYKPGDRGVYESDGFFNWSKNELYNWHDPNIQYIVAPQPLKATDYLKMVEPGSAIQNAIQQLASADTGDVTWLHYSLYALLWAGLGVVSYKFWKSRKTGDKTGVYISLAVFILGFNTVRTFSNVLRKPKTK